MKNFLTEDKISVVVQGKILPEITYLTLLSIRKYLPNAEIILSTWMGTSVNNLDYDKLVLSEEPQSFLYSSRENSKINNINKQIVSTIEGIKISTGKYILKLRTDFLLTGNSFLNFYEQFHSDDSDFAIFGHMVIACCYFSRDPRRINQLFHPSDIAFFGFKDDLLNLFDVPLMTEAEQFYIKNKKGEFFNRYLPEQHVFINFLIKNKKNIMMSSQRQSSNYLIEQTERYFANNFIFLNWRQFNLLPPTKLNNYYDNDYFSCVTHIEWKKLYFKYNSDFYNSRLSYRVLYNVSFFLKNTDRLKFRFNYFYLKLLKLIAKLLTLPILGQNNKKLRKQIRDKIIRFCSLKY